MYYILAPVERNAIAFAGFYFLVCSRRVIVICVTVLRSRLFQQQRQQVSQNGTTHTEMVNLSATKMATRSRSLTLRLEVVFFRPK